MESVKKNSPHIQQKILSEDMDESSSQSLEEEQPAMRISSSSSHSLPHRLLLHPHMMLHYKVLQKKIT